MKKDGKYRFCLQFAGDTDEQIQAGELLERLGNKKSSIVIAALNEYMENHPEITDNHSKIKNSLSFNSKEIRELVKKLVQEQLSSTVTVTDTPPQTAPEAKTNDDAVLELLNNLELFNCP